MLLYLQVLFFLFSTFRLGTTSHLLLITARHEAVILCGGTERRRDGYGTRRQRKNRYICQGVALLQLDSIVISLLPINKPQTRSLGVAGPSEFLKGQPRASTGSTHWRTLREVFYRDPCVLDLSASGG
jgi:hypothetical protein